MDVDAGKRYLKSQKPVMYNDSLYVIDSLIFKYINNFVVCKALLKDLKAKESYIDTPIKFVKEVDHEI